MQPAVLSGVAHSAMASLRPSACKFTSRHGRLEVRALGDRRDSRLNVILNMMHDRRRLLARSGSNGRRSVVHRHVNRSLTVRGYELPSTQREGRRRARVLVSSRRPVEDCRASSSRRYKRTNGVRYVQRTILRAQIRGVGIVDTPAHSGALDELEARYKRGLKIGALTLVEGPRGRTTRNWTHQNGRHELRR